MWWFDSASRWNCLISALKADIGEARFLQRKFFIGPISVVGNP
jgi:hypothetical protein